MEREHKTQSLSKTISGSFLGMRTNSGCPVKSKERASIALTLAANPFVVPDHFIDDETQEF
ncbi:MAG: hypothetical protein ABJ237_00760, partial [Parasphingorhabdus sp.]|uniref:hypothetical protein n=1 Tax=Parasphingorhabdus sp. TaxID=2709688 RepID=UPI0032996A97